MLIGITGAAGSGKSYAADFIGRWLGGTRRMKFAGPLKRMLEELLRCGGCPETEIHRYIEGDLKEKPTPYLQGNSPRWAMQTLGTEWGRECMGEDFWVQMAMMQAVRVPYAIFDDVRFLNEWTAIRDKGGVILDIYRPGVSIAGHHASEGALAEKAANFQIINDGDIADYQKKLQTFLHWLQEYEAGLRANI